MAISEAAEFVACWTWRRGEPGLRDGGVHPHSRALDAADRVQVAHVVRDVLDLQGVEHEAHAVEVVLRLLQQGVREARLVLVDLFGGELGEHAAQVALEGLLGDAHELLAGLAQEALDRVVEEGLLARQRDVGHPVHVQGDATLGVGAAHLDVDGDVREIDAVDELEEGHAQGAPAAHHAVADLPVADLAHAAGEDEGLVGGAHVEQLLDDLAQGDEDDEGGQAEDDQDGHHRVTSLLPTRVRMSRPTARAVSDITRATAEGKLATKAA